MRIDSTSWRSPNHEPRTERIRSLVLHTCEGPLPSPRSSSLPWLCNPASKVSCHYYVCRDGTIFQLVGDDQVAWHAGLSFFGGLRSWNAFSLGIECEHRAGQDWPFVQRGALQALCRDLISRYSIPQGFIVAHRWIAVDEFGKRGRRSDPTDWPDDQLRSWFAQLSAPPVRRFVALVPVPVFEARDPAARIALNNQAVIDAGDVFEVDDVTAGWAHVASGLGFLPIGALKEQP